jgi:hypothetical protein
MFNFQVPEEEEEDNLKASWVACEEKEAGMFQGEDWLEHVHREKG